MNFSSLPVYLDLARDEFDTLFFMFKNEGHSILLLLLLFEFHDKAHRIVDNCLPTNKFIRTNMDIK